MFGSQTLLPNSTITANGQIIVNSNGAVIVNGAAPSSTPPGIVVVGSSSITANSESGFLIGSQTLYPGSAITDNGEVITLPSPTSTSSTSMAQVVIGTQTFTQDQSGNLVFGTQTIPSGSAITVDGQVVSLSGSAVLVNAAPHTTSMPTTFQTSATQVQSVVIGGQTLTQGGRVTVGGDILSLAPSGTGIIVIGTVTIPGGESTATATASGKKKNAGESMQSNSSFLLLGLQSIFTLLGAFLLH